MRIVYKQCMTLEERASSLARDAKSRDEILALLKSHEELQTRLDELQRQLAWFQRQIFGSKSERRADLPDGAQLALGEVFVPGAAEPAPPVTVPSHQRRPPTPPWEGASDGRLRFDPSVPVQEIRVANPGADLYPPSAYDVVGQKVTYRLAQRPGAYVVLKYVRDVLKLKTEERFLCPPAPAAVIDKSFADVSFIAGLLVDKFLYHLPLYRQHQRLQDAGIHMARATLTNLVHDSTALLEPVYEAHLRSILESKVLGADETPIRAGRSPDRKGKMQSAYFWPLYGDRNEVAFPFSTSRSLSAARRLLGDFSGVLLSDGYSVYESYANSVQDTVRAQCWSHARRRFVEAETVEPELVKMALDRLGALYAHEDVIRERHLNGVDKLEYRTEHAKPVVDGFFSWLRDTLRENLLLPSNPFTRAASYALEREESLSVFLENPDVPVDTNHLEREIRPIAVGRKNWLFCWTEIGAKYVGIVQSLIRTCRLQGVDPYTYLVDILQRIATHPASEVEKLTPRLWKEHFAACPLRSPVDTRQDSGG
jgi:transposase